MVCFSVQSVCLVHHPLAGTVVGEVAGDVIFVVTQGRLLANLRLCVQLRPDFAPSFPVIDFAEMCVLFLVRVLGVADCSRAAATPLSPWAPFGLWIGTYRSNSMPLGHGLRAPTYPTSPHGSHFPCRHMFPGSPRAATFRSIAPRPGPRTSTGTPCRLHSWSLSAWLPPSTGSSGTVARPHLPRLAPDTVGSGACVFSASSTWRCGST